MALKTGDRYATALELAAEVERWLADEPVMTYREPRRARLTRWARRHRPVVAGTAALLVTTVVALSLGLVLLGRANTEIRGQRDLAEANYAEARWQREQADANLYRSLIGEARAIREARGSGFRDASWKRLKEAMQLQTPDKDLDQIRHDAGACLGDFVGFESVVWDSPASMEFGPSDLHPDGELLAIVLRNQSTTARVLIRNIATGQEVARFRLESARFPCVKFAADGRTLYAGGQPGRIKVWEVNSEGEWHGAKSLAALLPGRLAVPSPIFPFFVTRWELPLVYRLAVSPDGTQLAGCLMNARTLSDPAISVWNVADGGPASPFSTADAATAGMSGLWGIAYSPRGDLMAAAFEGGNSGAVLVWDVKTRKLKQSLRPELGAVLSVSFSGDGKNLACGCYEGVALFDTVDFQQRLFVRGDGAFRVAFSPDSQVVAIPVPESGALRLWIITTIREVAVPMPRDPGGPRFVFFAPDGKRLISAGGSSVRNWNLAAAAEKRTLSGHHGGVPGLAFSPDGKLLASAGKDHTVRLWDAASGRMIRELRGLSGPGQCVNFSPEARFLVSTEYTGGITIWDVRSGERISTVPHGIDVSEDGTAFSPDGRRFVVCGGFGAKIWNVMHRDRDEDKGPGLWSEEKARPTRTFANSPCFSPDGKLLAWTDGNQVSVWELATGQKHAWPVNVFSFLALSFLPDGKHLAMVNQPEGKIEVREATSGQVTTTFGKRELTCGRSIHTALSPDGAWLAVGGDKAVTVWDLNKRELVFALPEQRGTIWSLAWSPNKNLLAVSSSTGELAIWNLPAINAGLSRIGLGW
jgi:WD40 repeat protein